MARPALVVLASLCLAAPSAAEPAPAPPAEPADVTFAVPGGRVLHRFDFEERDDGNFEDIPMYFDRVEGVGMPHWVRGRLSVGKAHGGRHSFRLDINGGSVAYRLAHGVLPAVPGAHYRVDGHVATSDLGYARARLSAHLADAAGTPIPGSQRQSLPTVSAKPGDWTPIAVETSTDDPAARWLVIETALLQPGAGGADAGGAVEGDEMLRFRQDVEGTAWFDDLVVSRVPQVEVGRRAEAGVYRAGERVQMWAVATDPAAGDLQGVGIVRDARGDVAWQGPGVAHREPDAGGGLDRVVYDFDAGQLPPGWYSAEIRISGDGELTLPLGGAGESWGGVGLSGGVSTAVRRTNLVVLADLPSAAGGAGARLDDRFAVDATHLATKDWAELAAIVGPLGVGRVELAVWGGPAGNDVGEQGELFDAAADALRAAGLTLTAVFAGPTPAVAEAAGGPGWIPLHEAIEADGPAASGWRASLGYLVSRHAATIDRWQIGTIAEAEAFAGDPRLQSLYGRFAEVIGSLVARPGFALPWPVRQGESVEPRPAALVLRMPSDVPPRQIPLFVADAIGRSPDAEVSLHLEPADDERYGRLASLGDLVKRVTLSLAGGAGRLTLPLPFEAAGDVAGPEPTERFVVMRTLLTAIAGRAYQGRVPAGEVEDRVEAYLFADPADPLGRGTLVIWGNPTAGERTRLEMNLGVGAEHVDLWGNRRPLSQDAAGRRAGVAEVAVGPIPSLVVGVDAPLTRLRQTVRLDDPMIESSFRPHPRHLMMTNTFGRQISGTVRVLPPAGWEAELGSRTFNLNPGETLSRPFELRIPYNSDAGRHTIDVQIELRGATGDVATVLSVPVEVRLGLADVGLQTLARRDGGDLVVEQTITNYGETPIDYDAFVLVPDRSRQERLVVGLGPGQEAVRRYRFRGASDLPPGTQIMSGLREIEGSRVLNDRVEL